MQWKNAAHTVFSIRLRSFYEMGICLSANASLLFSSYMKSVICQFYRIVL